MLEACRPRSVFKKTATAVSVHRRQVIGKMRLEDVREAIAIVIANRYTHAGLRLAVFVVGQAGLKRDILEGAVAIVFIKDARRRVASDVDVRPAIVIIIGDDGGHRVAVLHKAYSRSL